MIRPVLTYPHPRLTTPALPVVDFAGIGDLLVDLVETMRDHRGPGLAAPQIGVNKRVFVVDADGRSDGFRSLTAINPELTGTMGRNLPDTEACLSLPGAYGPVRRPWFVRLRYQDDLGSWHETTFQGFLARVIQYELDHLNGLMFFDRMALVNRRLLFQRFPQYRPTD